MSLIVVGTVAFDALETPFDKVDKIVGGSGTYASLAASFFTNDISLVSVIGDDFHQKTLNDFKSRGIRIDGIEVKEGEKSFFWSGRYHHDMNTRDTLVTDLNVLANFNPVVPEADRNAEFLMLGNIDPNLQIKVIEQMNQRPKLIVLDTMNFWMDNTKEALDKVLAMVDVVTINDEEARQLAEEYSLVKSAKKILEKYDLKYLIVKKGEHGALLFDKDSVFFAPALPLEEVFDPTGAGDSFAGGFMGHLVRSQDISFENMKRAVIYGSAMASFCVEKFGPNRLTVLTREEIHTRVQEFINLVQFDISLVS